MFQDLNAFAHLNSEENHAHTPPCSHLQQLCFDLQVISLLKKKLKKNYVASDSTTFVINLKAAKRKVEASDEELTLMPADVDTDNRQIIREVEINDSPSM